MKAGKDIEFAIPALPTTTIFTHPPSPLAPLKAQGPEGLFPTEHTKGLASTDPPVSIIPAHPVSEIGNIACVGERITNFRQLLHRFSDYRVLNAASHTFNFRGLVNDIGIDNRHPFLSLLLCSYAFYVGGYRLALIIQSLAPIRIKYGGSALLGCPVVYNNDTSSERVFTIPWQCIVPFQYTLRAVTDDTMYSLQVGPNAAGSSFNTIVACATADDFSLGWQIGPDLEFLRPASNPTLPSRTFAFGPDYTAPL